MPLNAQKLLLGLAAPLRKLAIAVNKEGGWLKVTGRNRWGEMPLCHCPDPRRDYEKFLFPILKHIEYQWHGVKPPRNIKPQCIAPIRVVTPPASGELNRAFWRDVLDCEVAILRGFTEKIWPLDFSLYSNKELSAKHANAEIIDGRELKKLRDFLACMKQETSSNPSPLKAWVDICAWEDQVTDLTSKLPELLLFGSETDLLTYSRRHHPGLTLPLLTLKLPNHWSGARPAPLSLSTLNINAGPGAVDSWAMESEAARRFRAYLLSTRGVDILQGETELWPDENFLMIEGLQTYHGRQVAGDILYLGPGVCSWGKCKSASADISWCLGFKTEKQVKGLFEREEVDKALGQTSGVNIWTMALDYLNAELGTIADDLLKWLFSKLSSRFDADSKQIATTGLAYSGVHREHEVESCQHCKQALFYAYITCKECKYCICLNCAHKHIHSLSECYTLFASEAFERLKGRVEAKLRGETGDCFDPSLQLHVNLLKKCSDANFCQPPCHGTPSYSLFETDEATKPRKHSHSHVSSHSKQRVSHSQSRRHRSEMKALADLMEPTEDNDPQPDKKHRPGPDELPD